MPSLTARWTSRSITLRAIVAVLCGSILTFFASEIVIDAKMSWPLRIGAVLAIAAVGIGGIVSLLTTDDVDEDAPPPEKLYTADEVAALLAAVQAGQLVPNAPPVCKFCGGEKPEGTGIDGTRYHRVCFRSAYQTGKT
jgi:hypothetical protein